MTEATFDYDDLMEGTGGGWRQRLIWIGVLTVLLAAVATGVWWEFLRGGSAATAAVQTATVSMGNVTKTVSTSGTVAAQSTTNLNFTTTGTGSSRITKVDVALGQKVKQGDVLMELDPTDAQTALDSAKLSLSIQQSKLEALLQGGTASTLASADQSVQQAQATYDKAVRALQDLQVPADATTLETAQQSVTTAQAQLQQSKDARAKIDTDRSAGVTTAQSGVTKAQNALTVAEQTQTTAASNVSTAQTILFSNEHAYCSAALPAVSFCPAATTAPISAGDQAILAGQGSSALAAAAVVTANSSYTKSLSDKQTADNGVATAESALSDANAALTTAEAGPTAGQVAVADAAIGSAQAQVDTAQAKLLALQAGPTPEAIQNAQSDIDNAAASLTAAQAKRDETYAGPLPTDVQQQQAGVSQAQTAVDAAQKNLDNTKLIAPFDGTVAAMNNQAGDLAGSGTSSTTAAVVLNTPDNVILNMSIGETDYASVKVGQAGTAVFAGIPGRTFPIIIDAIGSSPTTTQGVVSYVVRAHFVAGRPGGASGNASGTPGARGQGAGASGTPGAAGQGAGGASGTPGAGGGQGGGRRATAAAATAGAGGVPTTPQAAGTLAPAGSGGTPTNPQAATPGAGTAPVSPPPAGGFGGAGGAAASAQMPVPGMNATITIITAQSQNVLRVPNAAVQRDGQNRVLQVKQSDGSVQKVTVEIGLADSTNTEITSGVSEGATVILPGVVATSSAAAGTGTGAGTGGGGFGGGFPGGGGGRGGGGGG
jgi:HlyD family secretion protein